MVQRYSLFKFSLSKTQVIVLLVSLIISLSVRFYFVTFESPDYVLFLRGWFNYIHRQGGMNAFKSIFSDYNVPYLYLLAIGNYLHLSGIWTVKIWGALFDAMGAWYIYKILLLMKGNIWRALLGGCFYLLVPTTIMISAVWGQADGIYTSLIIGGVYYYLQHRSWVGSSFIAAAFAFKLQAIFIFPAIAIWVLARKVSWKSLILIPAVYFILFIPIVIVGGSFKDCATVYLDQSDQNRDFSLSSPNIGAIMQYVGYKLGIPKITPWEHSALKNDIWAAQLGISCIIGFIFIYVGWRKVREHSPQYMILFATLSTFLFPMILPSMHERYMYTALSFVYICMWIFGSWFIVSFIILEIVNCRIYYYNFLRYSKYVTHQRVDAILHGRPYLATRAAHFGQNINLHFSSRSMTETQLFSLFICGICDCIALGLVIFSMKSRKISGVPRENYPQERIISV